MFSKTFALAALASMASGHILMTNPVPYGASTLTNGPLAADGSDFPCKMREGVYALDGAGNTYAQGSTQQLTFKGTAVHGGGSCQVVITQDLEPNKASVWKVIKSIEGGCPAQDQTGNMGDSASAEVPYKYDFTIPDELAKGEYTLAWTWFNKVGNREMYMNCAPLTVTGSDGSGDHFDSLPNMFVANIGNGCTTPETKDVEFPDPGQDVVKMNGATEAFLKPTDDACNAANPIGSAPQPTSPPTEEPEQPAPTSAPTTAPQQPAPSSTQSIPGGVFITVPTTAEPTAAPTEVPAPEEPTPEEPTPEEPTPEQPTPEVPAPEQPTEPTTPAPSNPAGTYAAGTVCSNEGDWNCIGGSSFQRCASGSWSVVMQLAAGVACDEGEGNTINMYAKNFKRSMRRALRIRA